MYLVYSFILLVAISVGQLLFVIRLCKYSTNVSSYAHRVNMQIQFIFASCFFTTYLVSAITRLIGVRNFLKISRKFLSVVSFVNYHEDSILSNAVITLHVVLFVTYFIRHSLSCIGNNRRFYVLHFYVSGLIRDIVTSFAAVQFLYLVFTLRHQFILLNSSLIDVVMSTVKSDNNFPLKCRTVTDFLPETYSVISGLRDILYRHLTLCDIMQLINSSYSLQVLDFVGSKFGYATIYLYILFFSIFHPSLFPIHSSASLITFVSNKIMQRVTVVYCCKSASVHVGVI
jgi:hypothetical protein